MESTCFVTLHRSRQLHSSMTPFMILLAVPLSSTRLFCSSSVTTSSPPRLLTCLARKLAVDFARAPPSCSRESEPSSQSQNGVRAVWAAPVCGARKTMWSAYTAARMHHNLCAVATASCRGGRTYNRVLGNAESGCKNARVDIEARVGGRWTREHDKIANVRLRARVVDVNEGSGGASVRKSVFRGVPAVPA